MARLYQQLILAEEYVAGTIAKKINENFLKRNRNDDSFSLSSVIISILIDFVRIIIFEVMISNDRAYRILGASFAYSKFSPVVLAFDPDLYLNLLSNPLHQTHLNL